MYDSFSQIFTPPPKKKQKQNKFLKILTWTTDMEDEKLVAWVCVRQTIGKEFQRELRKGDSVLTGILMSNLNKATMRDPC